MACMKTSSVVVLTALVVITGGQSAAAVEFKINPDNSAAIFKMKQNDISYLYGRFNRISGTIKADHALRPTKLELDLEIKVESIDTNSKQRDRDLTGADFLDAGKYPKIFFVTTTCAQVDRSKFEITGNLTMHGVTKEVALTFVKTGLKKVGMHSTLGGEVIFTFNRSEFGMDQKIPEFSDEITVMFSVEAGADLVPSG